MSELKKKEIQVNRSQKLLTRIIRRDLNIQNRELKLLRLSGRTRTLESTAVSEMILRLHALVCDGAFEVDVKIMEEHAKQRYCQTNPTDCKDIDGEAKFAQRK